MTETKYTYKTIGREAALALAATEWWKGLPARDIAMRQYFLRELSMPFSDFHKAMEDALGRPVFTHEFGLNPDGLAAELLGEGLAPSMEEIIEMIPAEKRILVTV